MARVLTPEEIEALRAAQPYIPAPSETYRVSVEAGSTFGWDRYIGERGVSVGIDRFGASAPGDRLFKEFGFTAGNVAAKARALL